MTPLLEYSLAMAAALVASTISGVAGFGGAILLLPALTLLFGIEKALPLLAFAQLVGNASRALFGLRTVHWRAVCYFLCGAVPLAVVATFTLTAIPRSGALYAAAAVICAVTLLEAGMVFSILPGYRERFKIPAAAGPWLSGGGALVGLFSGLAGSTGPLPNAFFLRLNLAPASYVATDAAAMGILHAVKLAAFGFDANWNLPGGQLAVSIAGAMVLGTWFGRRVLGRIEEIRYRRLVAVWMLVVAFSMFFVPAE